MAFRHAPSLTFSLDSVEVEALPSHRVLLSRWSSVLWPPPTSHPASSWISPLRLIPFVTLAVVHRWMRSLLFHRLLSQHLVLLTPEGPTRLHFQVLRRFHGLHYWLTSSAPSFFPFGLTFRRCKIHFMLRAAVLLPFLRELHRFSTTSHPAAPDACYMASWQLP